MSLIGGAKEVEETAVVKKRARGPLDGDADADPASVPVARALIQGLLSALAKQLQHSLAHSATPFAAEIPDGDPTLTRCLLALIRARDEDMRKRCSDRSRPHCEGTVVLYRLKVGTQWEEGFWQLEEFIKLADKFPYYYKRLALFFLMLHFAVYREAQLNAKGDAICLTQSRVMNVSRVAWETSNYPNFLCVGDSTLEVGIL